MIPYALRASGIMLPEVLKLESMSSILSHLDRRGAHAGDTRMKVSLFGRLSFFAI